MCLVIQSCLSLCDPMDYSLSGSSVHGYSPGKDTGVGCHACFQGIFSTQGLNPHLPHCRQIILLSGLPYTWLTPKLAMQTPSNSVIIRTTELRFKLLAHSGKTDFVLWVHVIKFIFKQKQSTLLREKNNNRI